MDTTMKVPFAFVASGETAAENRFSRHMAHMADATTDASTSAAGSDATDAEATTTAAAPESAGTTKNCFEIEHLNLWYGTHHALHDICIDIPSNQVTALIGPSGCGKSTFLKTLNRMQDLVEGVRIEGKVLFNGQDIYNSKIDVTSLRKNVGMVFQKANPFPMSIYDNVAYGPKVHGTRNKEQLDAIVEQSLKDAALWNEVKDRLKKSALGLSGGQQQRLCIARALAVKPQVLLLDESTSALDPISTGQIEELVGQLKKTYSVIMVTHNMQQAVRVSDHAAFFLLGDLVEFAPTEQLFNAPQDKRTADYVSGRFG